MLVIGHRGAMGYEAENTLRSFARAVECGVDMIELDVRTSKDGEVVVMHDKSLRRVSGKKGYVDRIKMDDLRRLNVGGECIPTLSDVLDFVAGRVNVNVEIKVSSAAEGTAKIIRHYVKEKNWKAEQFYVSSSCKRVLKKFLRSGMNVRVGLVVDRWPRPSLRFAKKIGAWAIVFDLRFVNEKFVCRAHNEGLKVLVWPVNEPDDIIRMAEWGVDGVVSDFPDRAVSCRNNNFKPILF